MTEHHRDGERPGHSGPDFVAPAPPPRSVRVRSARPVAADRLASPPPKPATVRKPRLLEPWMAVAAVTLAVLVLTVVPAVRWLMSHEGTTVAPATPMYTTPGPTKPRATGPPVVPHGNGGSFLSPMYAGGVTEFEVQGDGYSQMVGASADVGVVAVHVEGAVRGIDVTTTETVWTFPSFNCSKGTWDGVALCVNEVDRYAYRQGANPDVVGLDLSSGAEVFRFTPAGFAGDLVYVGQDEVHAYFLISIRGGDGDPIYGQLHVLALNLDGTVAWMTDLGIEDVAFKAVLAEGDNVVLTFDDTIVVVEGSTGAILHNQRVDATGDYELLALLWDGWLVGSEGEKPYAVLDQTGALVAEYPYVEDYIPSSESVGTTVVPVFGRDVLNRGGRGTYETWAVTTEGERVVGEVGGRIVDTSGNYLVNGGRLHSLSPDGALFLSDLHRGSIHDSGSGRVLGGFSSPERLGTLGILDQIVFQEVFSVRGSTIVVLLPA